MDEGFIRRAWRDSLRLRDHWLVTLLGTLGSGGLAWLSDVIDLTNFGQWQSAVLGAASFFVVSFAANLVRAPFRQRDEARALVREMRAASQIDPAAAAAERLRSTRLTFFGTELSLSQILLSWTDKLLRGAREGDLMYLPGSRQPTNIGVPIRMLMLENLIESHTTFLPRSSGNNSLFSSVPVEHTSYRLTAFGKDVVARLEAERRSV